MCQGRNRRSGWSGHFSPRSCLLMIYWERLGGGVLVCTCDSLLATAQARLNWQRRSTSQDWLDGLKTGGFKFQNFSGGHAPIPPSVCGLWPHLLWPDEYKLGDCAPAHTRTHTPHTLTPHTLTHSHKHTLTTVLDRSFS